MAQLTLEEMIEIINKTSAYMFDDSGTVEPTWFAQKADGQGMVILPPSFKNKNQYATLLRTIFKQENVVRYVSVMEAWCIIESSEGKSFEDVVKQYDGGISEHPDRKEGLFFTAEDSSKMMTGTRMIQRLPDGTGKLEPLVLRTPTEVKSRFNGLLSHQEPSN